MAARAAMLKGAEQVIVIDRLAERLTQVRQYIGAEILDYTKESVIAELKERTGGRGPDVCIEAVGMEAHGTGALDTEHLATHVMPLDDGPRGYRMFKEKQDGCVRAVFQPTK
ncbi:zinc-binding dehydrogenase [Mycolicibacterium grossiae]|uniref:Alcohol dehydrogenase-like C-terminal domain-containing protein n=1 Tax=Mycolicibacterium grossiae TaxID=1552759 RepID=A0A1E8Q8J6_9MYCO|nr:zinc-binding dehydrogenase [Mycolicibacterium grossiae]OFJ54766.1 hypothetical protein BEL07_05255 [Mycolicibacterium grossiae]